jgi:hypothetical protein
MKEKRVGLADRESCNSARAGVIGRLGRIKDSVPRVSQPAADLADQMVIRYQTFFFSLLCFLMWDDSYLKIFQSLFSAESAFSDR